jgi:very-short-patch-repair endonuclease
MTPPELRLWSALRARQLGVQFRRQVPLAGRYIADFCAPAVRLVVEEDGAHHEKRRNADARRDAELRRLGYRVLRVEAEQVRAMKYYIKHDWRDLGPRPDRPYVHGMEFDLGRENR